MNIQLRTKSPRNYFGTLIFLYLLTISLLILAIKKKKGKKTNFYFTCLESKRL